MGSTSGNAQGSFAVKASLLMTGSAPPVFLSALWKRYETHIERLSGSGALRWREQVNKLLKLFFCSLRRRWPHAYRLIRPEWTGRILLDQPRQSNRPASRVPQIVAGNLRAEWILGPSCGGSRLARPESLVSDTKPLTICPRLSIAAISSICPSRPDGGASRTSSTRGRSSPPPCRPTSRALAQ